MLALSLQFSNKFFVFFFLLTPMKLLVKLLYLANRLTKVISSVWKEMLSECLDGWPSMLSKGSVSPDRPARAVDYYLKNL